MIKYFCDKCGKEINGYSYVIKEKYSHFFEKTICGSCKKEYTKIIDKFDLEKQKGIAIDEFFGITNEAKE